MKAERGAKGITQQVVEQRAKMRPQRADLEKQRQAEQKGDMQQMLQFESDSASWLNFRPRLQQLFQDQIESLRRELKSGRCWPLSEVHQRCKILVHSIKRAWCELVGRPMDEHNVGSVLPVKMVVLTPKLIDAGADSMCLNPLMLTEEQLLKELEHGLLRLQGQTPPEDEARPRQLLDVPRGERITGVVVGFTEFPQKNTRGQPRTAFGKMIIEVQFQKDGPKYSLSAFCRDKQNVFESGKHVGLRVAWKYDEGWHEWSAYAEDVYPVVERHW